MTLAWFAELAIKSSLVCGATYLALYLLRSKSAGERSFVAHLGLAAIPLQTLASLFLPFPMMSGIASVAELDWLTQTPAPLWFIVPPAALLLGMTLFAVMRLFGLRNRSTVLIEPTWLGALAHAQRRMGFKSGAALLTSGDIASPVSWGLFRPTIVLDERALAAGDEAEAIIAHELAHVAGLDWAKLLLARIVTAFYWFNPLVWVLARTCHELREEAADDAVLNHDVDRTGYATILVNCARHECRGMLLAAHGVAPSNGSLRRRIKRVLDTTRRRAPAGTGFTLAAIGGSGALILPLAAMTLQPPMAPVAPVAARAPVAAIAEPRNPAPVRALAHTSLPPSKAAIRSIEMQAAATDRTAAKTQALVDATDRLVSDTLQRQDVRRAVADARQAVDRYTPGDLVAMSTQGVTPGWLREMAALGYRNLSAGQVVSMAVQGVGPQYVRDMAAAGYPRLTVKQLVAMRIHGVTPEFARSANRAGSKASADWLIAMRIGGYVQPVRPPHAPRAPAVPAEPNGDDD